MQERSDELPEEAWREITVAEGSQEPRSYRFSAQRGHHSTLLGDLITGPFSYGFGGQWQGLLLLVLLPQAMAVYFPGLRV